MLTLAQFRALKREFDKVSDAKVQAAVDAAAARTDATVFGALTDEAHMWLAAHLLAADPRGGTVRIQGMGFRTVYLEERQRIEDLVGPAQIAAAEVLSGECW